MSDGHLTMSYAFYKHYNVLTSFTQLIEKETVYSHTPSMIDQTIPTLDPQLTKSRNKTQHTRVVIFADDKTSLNSSTRLTLSIANTWKHFTSSSLDVDELEVKITDVKLWYKKTQASKNILHTPTATHKHSASSDRTIPNGRHGTLPFCYQSRHTRRIQHKHVTKTYQSK